MARDIKTKTVSKVPDSALIPLWLWEITARDGASDGYHEHYYLIAADMAEVTRRVCLDWDGDRPLAELEIERQGPAPAVLGNERGVLGMTGEGTVWHLERRAH